VKIPTVTSSGRNNIDVISKSKWSYVDIVQAVLILLLINFFAAIISPDFNSSFNDAKIFSYPIFSLIVGIGSLLIIYYLMKSTHIPTTYIVVLTGMCFVFFFVVNFSQFSDTNQNQTIIGVKDLTTIFFLGLSTIIITASFTIGKHKTSFGNLGFVKPLWVQDFKLAIVTWIISILIVGVWTSLLIKFGSNGIIEKLIPPDSARELFNATGENVFVMLIIVSVLAPISEELFFRGFMFSGLIKLFRGEKKIIIASIISSIVFAVSDVDVGAYFVAFVLGMSFTFLYWRTKTIWVPIFAHSLHNTTALLLVILSNKLGWLY